MTETNEPEQLATVIRALSVLELVARSGDLNLTQIAGRMKIGKTTAHRLVRTLTERGWLIRNGDMAYRIGPSVTGLLAAAHSGFDVRPHMRPLMEELRAATGETIHLTQLEGREVVYLEQLVSTYPVHSVSQVGGRSPAHCVSPGIAQLAAGPEEYLEWFMGQPLHRHTPTSITHPARFRKLLQDVRQRGYAVNIGGFRPDVGGIAVAVPDSSGAPILGLSVCAPVYRLKSLDHEWIGAMLISAAKRAAEAIESGNAPASR